MSDCNKLAKIGWVVNVVKNTETVNYFLNKAIKSYFSNKKVQTAYLPQNLKTIRTRWRLSQEEMADLLRIESKGSKSAVVSNWERGVNNPGIDYLLRLQDIAQVDLNRLLRSFLSFEDIPPQPVLEKPYPLPEEQAPPQMREPVTPYGELYDYRELVRVVRALEKRVEKLEGAERK